MQNRFFSLLLFILSCLFVTAANAVTHSNFTVVIDPGHGGKDAGALGISSVKEKDIVLSVGLKLGKLINERHPEVRVIYTRSTDVFIPLDQRAYIANKAKANLFISIHADHAETSTVKGASTFTLGQNRSNENFEIAKRENSVILLEDNYKKRYEGFDPNSAESYIMFEFMQDNYMNQSIQFASTLQNKFVTNGRRDRGVRQAAFLVLRCTSMPSVLVELGFLSNGDEEQFLKKADGQDQMAASLLKGFTDFKNNYERKSTGSLATRSKSKEDEPQQTDTSKERTRKPVQSDTFPKIEKAALPANEPSASGIVFKIQMTTSTVELSPKSKKLKGIDMDYFHEGKVYKYTFGNYNSFDEANRKRREFRNSFPDAFVIAFKNGQKIPIQEARAQSKH